MKCCICFEVSDYDIIKCCSESMCFSCTTRMSETKFTCPCCRAPLDGTKYENDRITRGYDAHEEYYVEEDELVYYAGDLNVSLEGVYYDDEPEVDYYDYDGSVYY